MNGTREPYRLLDLFSGIGGFSLGLERTGVFNTVAFCEIDPYASAVLARHWPDVPNLGDVTTANFANVEADAICAGFPCQDLSNAGKRAGLAGDRSGLVWSALRAVRVVRPRFVLLENVAALHSRGLGEILGDLASLGYDTRTDCIPASHVGAPHDRDRTWIVAHALGGERWQKPYGRALGRMGRQQQSVPWDRDWQGALREFRGVDDGSAYRVDRIDTLRNGLVPQIPELIGRAILASERLAA
jgi:DNA (cytosine-5)-methyltransferase 1